MEYVQDVCVYTWELHALPNELHALPNQLHAPHNELDALYMERAAHLKGYMPNEPNTHSMGCTCHKQTATVSSLRTPNRRHPSFKMAAAIAQGIDDDFEFPADQLCQLLGTLQTEAYMSQFSKYSVMQFRWASALMLAWMSIFHRPRNI